jgi:branched-chain amino acid transport system permease protein
VRARGLAAWACLAAAGPLAAALVPSTLVKSLLAQACISAMYALGVGVLLRQSGLASFGHAAFFGLPGYLVAILSSRGTLPFELALLAAVAATALAAFAIGLVVVRVQGIAFGMLTLAMGQGAYEAATHLRAVTGGHDGLSVSFPRHVFGVPALALQRPGTMLALSSLLLVAALAAASAFAASRRGRLTEAIRDNEERARFLGYGTLLPRALSFAASAAITAVAGILFILNNGFISPETVHWTASGSALIMAILGGTAAPWGPVLGGFAYFGLKEWVGGFTTHWLGIIGGCLILTAVAFPEGLSGVVRRLPAALRRRGGAGGGAEAGMVHDGREVPDAGARGP